MRLPWNVDECGSSHDNENTGLGSHSPTHHKARQINRYRIHVEVAEQRAQHPKSQQHKSVQFKMATEVSSLARVPPVNTPQRNTWPIRRGRQNFKKTRIPMAAVVCRARKIPQAISPLRPTARPRMRHSDGARDVSQRRATHRRRQLPQLEDRRMRNYANM